MSETDALIQKASEDRRSEILHMCRLVIFPGLFNSVLSIAVILPVLLGEKIVADGEIRGMTDLKASRCFSCYWIGWALASITIVPISDRIGRRLPVLLLAFVGVVAACMATFSTTVWLLGLSIFVMGFTIPPSGMIAYVLCGESVSDQWHPALTAGIFTNSSFITVMMSVFAGASEQMNWRIEWLWCLFPYAGLLIVGPWFFSESPKFTKELKQSRGDTRLHLEESRPEASTTAAGSNSAASEISSGMEDLEKDSLSFKLLFQPQYLRALLDTTLCWFVVAFSYYGLSYAAGQLSPDLYTNVLLEGCVDIVGYLLAGPITYHFGPFPTQIGAFGVAMMAFFVGACLPAGTLLVTFSLFGRLSINVAFSTVYILVIECFPPQCCATAIGVTNAVTRCLVSLAPFLSNISGSTTCALLCVLALISAFATWDLHLLVKGSSIF